MKQIIGAEHIGVKVSDMDRSIAFYRDVLGLPLRRRVQLNETVELAFLPIGGTEIELIGGYPVGSEPGPVDHFAFTVDDIDGAVEHLRRHGVEFVFDEPRTILEGQRIVFFKGPDGERIELFQRV